MIEKIKIKPDELLMEIIGFDEDDLAANRAGMLGPNQVVRLIRLSQRARVRGWLAIVFGIAILILILVYSPRIALNGIEECVPVALLFVADLYILVPIGIGTLLASSAQVLDSQMKAVERTEGRVSLDMHKVGGWIRPPADVYIVHLEGRDWTVTREEFLAFKNGDPYALYYGPRSSVVLAAEWLREPPPMDAAADHEAEERLDTQEKPKHGGIGR